MKTGTPFSWEIVEPQTVPDSNPYNSIFSQLMFLKSILTTGEVGGGYKKKINLVL